MTDRRTLGDPLRGPGGRGPAVGAFILVSGLIAIAIGWRYGLVDGVTVLIGLLGLVLGVTR